MNLNLPTMTSASHTHSSYSPADFAFGVTGPGGPVGAEGPIGHALIAANHPNHPGWNPPKGNPMPARRVVQVFIADPNENISLDDCLLFKGIEKVTDATDQELFFELDIKDLLRPALAYLQPPAPILHSVVRLPVVIQHPVRSPRHGRSRAVWRGCFYCGSDGNSKSPS
jgi:hypothetical protein